MRMITFPKATSKAALAVLLLGGGLALAPEAQAGSNLNGLTLNGVVLNGLTLNGVTLNGERMQGQPTGGDAAGLGALQVRAVRLPDGRTLLAGQR